MLLEEILGKFDPLLHSEIIDIRSKFLFHCGIPCTSGISSDVIDLIRLTKNLSRKVTERGQLEGDLREQAKQRVKELVPPEEQTETSQAVDFLLDGLGKSRTTESGLLAFYSCWGADRINSIYWSRLDAHRIEKIFDVTEKKKSRTDLCC